jgi:hypothetical protein
MRRSLLAVATLGYAGVASAGSLKGDDAVFRNQCEEREVLSLNAAFYSTFVLCADGNPKRGYNLWAAPGNKRPTPLATDTVVVVMMNSEPEEDGASMSLRIEGIPMNWSPSAIGDGPPPAAVARSIELDASPGRVAYIGSFGVGALKVTLTDGPGVSVLERLDKAEAQLRSVGGDSVVDDQDRVTAKEKEPLQRASTQELLVAAPITGGLRVGVAAIMGDAVRSDLYGQSSKLNPDVRAVFDASSKFDAELTLGYSRYLHRRAPSSTSMRIAPTAAVGIVDVNNLAFTGLTSLYVGFDFGWDELSIGPAYVLRKVPELAGGLSVGDLTAADPIPKKDVWKQGFAIILYSPSLFSTKR